ncbi:hypothetical protein [Mesorhizobium sp. M0496]|uniref:hypothetical protein n=1 Tax=Mesorhizobium sp. M0496 TaxID=2956952 RepID=UPI0033380D25
MLVVTTPATDLALAPIAALRAAAGVTGASRDTELAALGLRIAAEITEALDIAVGQGAEPTLRAERLTETFDACGLDELILSRRHDAAIVSITQDGDDVTLDTRSLDPETGLLQRWIDGRRSYWRARSIVVVYDAGFEAVPPTLVGAVTDLVRLRLSAAGADPLEKSRSVEIPDVRTVKVDRWVSAGSGASAGIPDDIMDRLARFNNNLMVA